MFEIFKLFFDICLLKKRPQDVPLSRFLFWFSMTLYGMVGLLMLHLSMGWLASLLQLSAEIIILLVFTAGILYLKGRTSRFFPVVTALLGADALISFFALPVIASITLGRTPLFSELVYLSLVIWSWLVMGHIFRHALTLPLSFGLGVAFVYIFSTLQIMGLLFPEMINVTGA